jgi:RNA polymerase sigma-B factor
MLHHLRDVEQPLRCSRQLRELHRRGQLLQQQRLHRRLPPLGEAALAAALGCRPQRWQEALQLHRALRVCSLDAPTREGDGQGGDLLEQLPAREQPHPYRADHQLTSLCCEPESQQWVRTRLDRLEPGLRRLLQERVLQGASWRRLGERQGLRARTAQRRFQALLVQLRQEIQELVETAEAAPAWPERAGVSAVAGTLRSPASLPAPWPAASPARRRSGSAEHSPVRC